MQTNFSPSLINTKFHFTLNQYKSIIIYTIKNELNYELKGTYQNFSAEHGNPFYNTIEFNDANNVFNIKIGKFERRIIVIANEPEYTEEQIELLKINNTYVFYFSENSNKEFMHNVCINPLDPDSVERVGIFIKKFLLSSYNENLKRKFKFPQLLRDYVKYFPQDFLSFDITDYTYKFHSYPKSDLKEDEIKKQIEIDTLFRKKTDMTKTKFSEKFLIL